MVADIGKDGTSSKLCFLVLCFHTRITTHVYPPSAQVTIQSHPSLTIIAFALCTSKYSHITLHIPSNPLSQATPLVTLPSTTSKNNTPRQASDKQSFSPGICSLSWTLFFCWTLELHPSLQKVIGVVRKRAIYSSFPCWIFFGHHSF